MGVTAARDGAQGSGASPGREREEEEGGSAPQSARFLGNLLWFINPLMLEECFTRRCPAPSAPQPSAPQPAPALRQTQNALDESLWRSTAPGRAQPQVHLCSRSGPQGLRRSPPVLGAATWGGSGWRGTFHLPAGPRSQADRTGEGEGSVYTPGSLDSKPRVPTPDFVLPAEKVGGGRQGQRPPL